MSIELRKFVLHLANDWGGQDIAASPGDVVERAATYYAFFDTEEEKTVVADKPAAVKEDKYVIFHPDGTKRAGYTHSKDALKVLQVELAEGVTSVEDLDGFQKHNMPAMARLVPADIVKLQASVADKVAELKMAQEATQVVEKPEEDVTPAEPSDADLAALFAPPTPKAPPDPIVEVATGAKLPKEVYVKEMMGIARALGAPESGAWLLKAGYDNILNVPEDKRAWLVQNGKERIAELQGS